MKHWEKILLGVGLVLTCVLSTILVWNIFHAQAADVTWDNEGGDGLWSTCTNWTTDTCPGPFHFANFDPGISDTSSTIDPGFAGTIAGIYIYPGFTGTITQARSLTFDTFFGGGFEMYGGSFVGGVDDIIDPGFLVADNASFTSTSGTMNTPGSFQISGTGSFTHNSGTIIFDCPFIGGFFGTNSTVVFNNAVIDCGSDFVSFSSYSGNTIMQVDGDLNLVNGNIDEPLVIDVHGTITHTSTFDGGDGLIEVTAGAGTISSAATGFWPGFTLSTARTLLLNGTTTTFEGNVTVEDGGTFTGSTGDTLIQGSLDLIGPSTFDATTGTTFVGSDTSSFSLTDHFNVGSGVTFNPNGGTMEIGNRRIMDIDVDTSLTFFNLNFDTFSNGLAVNIATGDTLIVPGQLLLDEGILNGGTVEVAGTFSQTATYGGCDFTPESGSAIIHVIVPVAIAPPLDSSNSVCFPGLHLDNAGASFTGAGTGNITYIGGDLTITAGTFDATDATTYLYTDADFALGGGTFNDDNGTFIFYGGDQSISGSPTFYGLQILGTDITYEAGSTTVIDGDFVMDPDSGTLNVRSSITGVQANLDFNGPSYSFTHLDVQDNEWIAGSPAICSLLCSSSGNNTNWTFVKKVVVTDISAFTSEPGGNATFTVVLDQGPDANVTIPVSSSDTSEGTVSTASLVFTTSNWFTPQTVTVTGVNDVLDDGGIDYTIILGAAVSADLDYSGFDPRDVSVTNLDDDSVADNVDYDFPSDYTEQVPAKTDLNGSVAQMAEDDFIATSEVILDVEKGDIIYDSVNNSVWFAGDSDNLYEYDITGANLNSYPTGSFIGPNQAVAHDSEPTRNRIWTTGPYSENVFAYNDDGTVFGTFQVNPYFAFCSRSNRLLFVDNNDGLPGNDSMWVGNADLSGVAAVTKLSAVTGAPAITDLATSTIPLTTSALSTYCVTAMAYDPGHNAVWVTSTNDADNTILVVFNSVTGDPLNGTLTNSTYVIPPINVSQMEYDSVNNYLWILGDDHIMAIDPDDGSLVTISETPASLSSSNINMGLLVDEANNLLVISDIEGNLYHYDIQDDYFAETYDSNSGAGDIVFDSEGDIWVLEAQSTDGDGSPGVGNNALEEVRYGVTENTYYTVITNSGGALDSSSWTDLTDVAVTEALDGQSIYYSIAFDCCTNIMVYTGGAWRAIASDEAATHGGIDGNWYYRDNGNTWTAAASNNSPTAISQAVAAGANNQMTGATLNALSAANLVSLGGWTVASNSVYVGVTFFSNNYQNNPAVDNVAFTPLGGGGSAGVTVTESGGSTDIVEGGATDTYTVVLDTLPTSNVTITITPNGQQTTDFPSLLFTTLNWFTPQTVTVTAVADGVPEGPHVGLITHSSASADLAYSGIPVASVIPNITETAPPGGGSSGPTPIIPSDISVVTPACTNDRHIYVSLTANNAQDYLIAETPDFLYVTWQAFTPDVPLGNTMTVPFTLSSGDGVKTLYVKFRSSTNNQSATFTGDVQLDEANACVGFVPPPPDEPVTPVPPNPVTPPTPIVPPTPVANASVTIAANSCLVTPLIVPAPAPAPLTPVPAQPIPGPVAVSPVPSIPVAPVTPTVPTPVPAPTPSQTDVLRPPTNIPNVQFVPIPGTEVNPPVVAETNPLTLAEVREAVVTYSFPAAAGAAAAALVILGSSFNLFNYLYFILTSPVLLYGRKRRQSFGVVYNSVTKVPIGLSTIRVFDAASNRRVKSLVTSPEGKYFLALKPGDYRLEVSKPGFVFPSLYLSQVTSDGMYDSVYTGQTVKATLESPFIMSPVPVDPSDAPDYQRPNHKKLRRLLSNLQLAFGSSGLILSVVVFVLSPLLITGFMVVSQIVILGLVMRLGKTPKPHGLGYVYDHSTGQPLGNVIVRLFEPTYNKLVETTTTDAAGRYWFILGPNEYYLSYAKPGYVDKLVKPVDTKGHAQLSLYSRDISLVQDKQT